MIRNFLYALLTAILMLGIWILTCKLIYLTIPYKWLEILLAFTSMPIIFYLGLIWFVKRTDKIKKL